MSQQRIDIKKVTVNQSHLPRSYQSSQNAQLISGNRHITTTSTTGYHNNTGIHRTTISRSGNAGAQSIQGSYGRLIEPSDKEIEWRDVIQQLVVSGDTDFTYLKNMQKILFELSSQLRNDVRFEGKYKQSFEKRLMLLEHEFDGLIRRVLNIKSMYPDSGARNVDYMKFVSQLQNKIDYLERQLQKHNQGSSRNFVLEIQGLKIQSQRLQNVIRQKDQEIRHLQYLLRKQWGLIGTGRNQVTQHIASLQKHLQLLKNKNPNMESLEQTIQGWIAGLPGCRMQQKLEAGNLRVKEDEHYISMVEKLKFAQDLYNNEMTEIEKQLQQGNSQVRLPARSKVLDILGSKNTKVGGISTNGLVEIQRQTRIERQIPVADQRTKALVSSLGQYIKKIVTKYPKLKQEMDIQLQEYMSTELVNTVFQEDLDRIVEITKYVPQMVRVQNIYSYDSSKTRKAEFHLKLLLKSLMMQLDRIIQMHKLDIVLDDGLFRMISQQIPDFDYQVVQTYIAKYREAPKVREVPKIVQKVLDVPTESIPRTIVLDQKTASVHPVNKVDVVRDNFGIRLEEQIPVEMVHEKALKVHDKEDVPLIHTRTKDRPVPKLISKTGVQEAPVMVQKIVENYQYRDIKEQIPLTEQIIKEIPKIEKQYIKTIQEVLKPCEVIVEKVVQLIRIQQKAVPVQLVKEKLVKQTQLEIIKEKDPILVTKYQILKDIKQKLVQVVRTKEQIVLVDKIMQKIVPVKEIVEVPVEVPPVIEQVMVKQTETQIIEVQKNVPYRQQVAKQVTKYIQKPIFVEHATVHKQFHQKPIVHNIQKQTHIPVEIMVPVIVQQQRPVEIPTTVNHFVKEQIPVLVKEQTTVPVVLVEEKIRHEPQIKQKIIEKIVEVPKTQVVEKIVEKIVVVPRIVEKIVEVPQIVQKIVEKRVQVPVQLPPIQKIIERPCVVEVPVQVPVEKIVYISVQKEVQVIKQKLVKDLQRIRQEVPVDVIQQRVEVQTREVPVDVYNDRIQYLEQQKIVNVAETKVLPVQIKVPVPLQKTVPVILQTKETQVLPVPRVVQKVVIQHERDVVIQPVQKRIVEHVVQKEVQFVDRHINHVETKHVEVPCEQQVLFVQKQIVPEIKQVPVIVQQAIPVVKQIQKIFQFQIPKTIPIQKNEIVEVMKPYIVNINKYIDKIRQKIVEVPYLLRQAQIHQIQTNPVIVQPEKHTYSEKGIQMKVEKQLTRDVEKKVVEQVHHIQQVLQTVTDVIERDKDPVIITQDRIIEIPVVIQKIVQKITMMPQIVEVLKHVHELAEQQNLDALVGLGDGVEWLRYRQLIVLLQPEIAAFIEELIRLKAKYPQNASKIQFLQLYLVDLRKVLMDPHSVDKVLIQRLARDIDPFIEEMNKLKSLYSDCRTPQISARIQFLVKHIGELRTYLRRPNFLYQIKTIINVSKVGRAEKQIIRVPRQKTAEERRQELSRVILIENLLGALSKIKVNHHVKLQDYLQPQVMDMFGVVFNGSVSKVNESFNRNLKKFTEAIMKKFQFTVSQQQMLKSFIDQRFQLANVVRMQRSDFNTLKEKCQQLQKKVVTESYISKDILNLLVQFSALSTQVLPILDQQRNKKLYLEYKSLYQKFLEYQKRYNSRIIHQDFGQFTIGKEFVQKYMGSHQRELLHKISVLEDRLKNSSNYRVNSDVGQYQITINRLKADNAKLQSAIRQMTKDREIHMVSPKGSVHTNYSPKKETQKISSQSDVQAYGANFGGYINADANDVGMVHSRKQYFPSYGSSVEVPRDLANSSATYRSGQYVNSSQHIKMEGTGGHLSVESSSRAGGYASSNTIPARYGNNVQITTSRITTDKGQLASGQITAAKPEGASVGTKATVGSTSGGQRSYQFYQKKYERN